MPDFDGGHYFLTAFAPIDAARLCQRDGVTSSPVHLVRDAIATLPTALQSPAAEELGINSPFARSTRTHLSRFVVVDDVVYNGRDPVDAIKAALPLIGSNPITPQSQDTLSCPYLLFVADFDATSGDIGELRSYLAELWNTMHAELRAVFGFCHGFADVTDAASFASYIERCQVETTMPFNDYWESAPPLTSLKNPLIGLVAALAIASAAGGWYVDSLGWSLGSSTLLGVVAFLGSLAIPYQIVMTRAAKPFPAAPNSDLPSILKALYLQQRFTQLVIDVQGKSDADIHAAFGAFVATHRPTDVTQPTQQPGVIHS